MTGTDLAALEAIRRTLGTFCLRVDEYDTAGVAEVLTDDCHVDYGPGRGGPLDGRAAVIARIARGQAEFRRTHHQLGQSVVDVEGDLAHAVTYVTAWHEDWDGGTSEVRLRYVDDLRHGEDGRWRIERRMVLASGIVGFPGVEWNYVPRAQPAERS